MTLTETLACYRTSYPEDAVTTYGAACGTAIWWLCNELATLDEVAKAVCFAVQDDPTVARAGDHDDPVQCLKWLLDDKARAWSEFEVECGRRVDAEAERDAARAELSTYQDGHLCHPRNSLNSDSGGICAHCGRTLLEQPGYEDALTKARAEVKRLTERVHEDNAVCLCGCSVGDHENLGEDGEGCGHDDHQCLRVPVAVAQIVADLRASVRERERAVFEATVEWCQVHIDLIFGAPAKAELDRRYLRETKP